MISLIMAPKDVDLKVAMIKDKKTKDEILAHIANLGFVKGAKVRVVFENDGNLIVKIKDSRLALGKDIAKKIIVEEL
ncbi:ferrous iron transport protein A [Peptoniphilus koenoeneniae]|uniref:Ferrous iron transport protein A n=1 Tax=Peptoniphilus koenoeneniae TaxID=507751 RepID=A0ABU0AUV6_9FIRM|nr:MULTISPECIES: FeoA family protein [Peptoniphilus]ERT57337.1 FeoA domain protein [Peptoniphilus sp. BV3C26]MDQ0275036.1 ferrous iron transport protein A [Peptoniphilus koenoeneniae]